MLPKVQRTAPAERIRLRGGRWLGLLAVGVVLSACSIQPINNEDNYLYRPPAGTVIDLKQDLVVRVGVNQAYVQSGEPRRGRKAVDAYTPWCEFRVKRPLEAMERPHRIRKGSFVVTNVYRGVDYSAADVDQPVLVADGGGALGGVVASRDRILWPAHPEVSMENMATTMLIESESQSLVYSVVCMIFGDALASNHLTLREIRRVLRPVATIRLPGE